MKTLDVIRIVKEVVRPLKSKVNTMITRIVVDAVIDTTGMQSLNIQALKDEDLDEIEHMQPGGLSHAALPKAEGILFCVAGNREVAIALGVANRDARPKGLLPGETALYMALPSPIGGIKVLCKVDGTVVLNNGPVPDATCRASKVDAFIATLDALFRAGWTPVALDGGAALKVAYLAAFAAPPASVASAQVTTGELLP